MEQKGKSKSLWAVAQPKFISPLPLGYTHHTLEEGDFFRKYVKKFRVFSFVNSVYNRGANV